MSKFEQTEEWRKRSQELRLNYNRIDRKKLHDKEDKELNIQLRYLVQRYLLDMSIYEVNRRARDGTVTPTGIRSARLPPPLPVPIPDKVWEKNDEDEDDSGNGLLITRSSLTNYDYGQSRCVIDQGYELLNKFRMAR